MILAHLGCPQKRLQIIILVNTEVYSHNFVVLYSKHLMQIFWQSFLVRLHEDSLFFMFYKFVSCF